MSYLEVFKAEAKRINAQVRKDAKVLKKRIRKSKEWRTRKAEAEAANEAEEY